MATLQGILAGKTALVFGGGSSDEGWSNGKAAAVLYAREGARVFVVDIDGIAASATAELIQAEGGTARWAQADIRKSDDIKNAVDKMIAGFGQIDILHNNVGITEMGDPIDMTEESWHRVMDINATGVFLTCKHVLPHMLARNGGAIVNISSTASIQINSYPYFSYFASKAAVNHFTRALAVRYAPNGIRANAVLPGVMDTPLIYKQISTQFETVDEMVKARNAASPMGRMGDAWDVAEASLFLASDRAKYITGVCLPVDGGKSCAGR
jgi:NAD(P)-dependent dehydrogenase (short-subunit alcohol dehydrogenase family)